MRPVHVGLFARLRPSLASFGLFFALYTAPAFAATPTTTTLTASSNNVVAGAVVTLTATVTNPGPVGQGTVLFCNASVSQCTQGRGLYGAVQLNSAGSAVLRLRFGSGIVNIQAKFAATRSNAGSTSLTSSIGVSSGPVYASSTSLTKAGSTGNYTLTGTVGGFGSGALLGSVSFLDTSNGNTQVGTASLGSFSTSLSAPVPNSVGNGATKALVGDLNGDGILDIVEADYGDGTISVLLGNSDGTFQARRSYPAGLSTSPSWISMGDLNGDGIQDVVCNGQGNSTISVLLGNGDGSFRTGASYSLPIGPSAEAIGDFNGDGILDLAVAGNTSSTVAILLGNGDGTFQPQTTYPIGTNANTLAVGDFNGDGNLDLVVANSGSNTISVLLGNGDGTFQPQTTYATGSWPDALAVADLNGDGHLDIVVGSYSSSIVGVFIGNGDGTFQPQRGYAASGPVDVGVADLDGDGRPDLVVANYSTNTIATLLGNGDGTFKAAVTSPSGRSPASIAFGDFNGDGMLDVVTPNNSGTPTVSVLFGEQAATFRVTGFSVSGSGTHNVLATYTGDATHTSSQSPTVALTAIVKTTPTVSVSCSPNPLTYGSQDSNCTVAVTGGSTPNGTVVWTINGGAWTSNSLFMGTDSESTFSTSDVGVYTVNVAYGGDGTHNPASGSTVLTINPSGPSILMWSAGNQFESTASLSLAPVTAGNANGVTAQAFGGNSPTGTVAFTNGGTNYGTLPLQSVSTTNLLMQSGLAAGWAVNAQVFTANTGLAPDGTNTAASLVSNGGDNQLYESVSTGNISGQTFTSSIWVKGIGSTIGKTGRIWVFPADYAAIQGCDVPVTANWARVSCTASLGPGYAETVMLARYDLPRYGEAAGDTVLVWGPQFESSASVGPYVPTTTAAATMSQPVAVAGSYVTSPGAYTVTATYSGDGSNATASGSSVLTAIAATPLSVISVSPTTTPYGSPVNLSALISTGGDVPSGTVNFASDGSNVASAVPTSATTTNYIPYSRDFKQWAWEATNPTSVTRSTVPGPNGVPGDVATVVFPTTTGTYSGIRYTDSSTNLVGKTMTFSFWVRGDVPSSLSMWLADWPYSSNFAAGNGCNVTTTWQRCTVSGVFPSNANGGFYVPIRSDNQASPITVYLWGPQLNEGGAGPYVSTAGTARTASGGVAAGSVSTLVVGTHAMTAAVSADANINAATSVAVSEIITDETTTMAVSCLPLTYGPASTTCTATGLPSGATGSVTLAVLGGPWTTTTTWSTSAVSGGSASGFGFSTAPAGSYTITASYTGDSDYSPASATTTLTINKATPVVTLACSPTTITYGGPTYSTCTSTVTSGATGTNAWSINGPWVTTPNLNTSYLIGVGNGVGTETVGVSYSGDANYNAATATSVPVVITQAPQTIAFTPPPTPVTYGVSPISLSATGGNSGNAVTFAVTSGPASVSNALTIDSVNGNRPYRMISQGTNLYMTTQGGSGNGKLAIVDISSPGAPALASLTTGLSTSMNGIGIQGTTLFVTYYGNSQIQSWNVSNPRAPVPISTASVCTHPYGGMVISGNYAYVPCPNTGGTGQVSIVNISNPAAMSVVGTLTALTGTNPTSLSVQNNVLYMNSASEPSQSYVTAYSLTNPTSPTLLGQAPVAHSPQYVAANGTTVLTTAGDSGGIQAINFSNPSSPVVSSPTGPCISYTENTIFYDPSGNYALVSCYSTGFYLVNTSNPAALSVVGTIGSWIADPTQILVVGQNVYVGSYGASTLSVFSWASPTLMQTSAFGNTGTLTITGAGTVVVSANQAGNGNYSAATPVQETIVVNKAPTVTELSSSANPIAFGGSTTFTALVDTGGGIPSGTVAFASNGVSIGSGTVSTVTTTNLIPNSNTFTSWSPYGGSFANVASNTSDVIAPDGTQTATKITLPSTMGPSDSYGYSQSAPSGLIVGQTYTVSVWLRGAVGGEKALVAMSDYAFREVAVTSTWQRYSETYSSISSAVAAGSAIELRNDTLGSTIYMWGAQIEQAPTAGPYVATGSSAATGSGAIATLTTTTLPVGSDSIVATFSGDANTLTSASSPLIETVNDDASSMSVSCSPNPATYSPAPATPIASCVATLTGGGTGTVTFNGVWTVPVVGTSATLTGFNTMGAETLPLTAVYSGDADHSTASASTTLTISPASQVIIFTAPTSPVTFGVSPITLTAGVPSGLGVTFSVVSGPATISGNTLTITGVGTVIVAANQAGNSNYLPAVQVTQSITVNSGVTSTTLTVLPSTSVPAGAVVTLTATVTNPSAVTHGTVLFCNAAAAHCSQGLGLYGSVSLSTAGTAVLKMKLPVGVNNVKAVFVATNTNTTSTSASSAVTVAASPIYASSTTIAYNGSPGNYNVGGFVTAFGGQTFGGSVGLLDTTNGNAKLYSAPLSSPYYQYPQTAVPIATRSWSSAVGDFNGDGIPDLAVATYTGNVLDILLGNGDGTFQAAVPYALTSAATSVVAGDFNGDGILDLAVANTQTNNVSVFIGVGNGTFLPQVKYAVGGSPSSISIADFNGDGIMDMAVTDQTSNTVSILLGNGDGTFQPQVAYATGAAPMSVTSGDFNGDGKIDLAVANSGSTTISVLMGHGDGTFAVQVPYAVGNAPSAVTTGDVNNDGHLDLVVANSGSSNASVLIGNGDGTFGAGVAYATGSTPMSVALGDFNNDGTLDLITGNNGTVSLLLGSGSGTFGAQSSVASGYSYEGVTVADFNGDGILDFAANENNGTSFELVSLGQLREMFNVTGVSVVGSGTHNILASYPGDSLRTASQSPTVPLTATKLTPVLTWATPAAITYGTPLSATQLNATSGGLAGTFAYTPAAGAIEPAGTQTLSVTFTPTDTVDYNNQTATVSLVVNKVALTVTPNPGTRAYGIANPGFTGSITGMVAGDGITATYASGATAATVVGIYSSGPNAIASTLIDPGSKLGNYTVTQNLGTLTITKTTTTVTLTTSSNPASYGTSVTFTAQIAVAGSGTITFLDGATSIGSGTVSGGIATFVTNSLAAGTHNITASYGGDSNYSAAVSAILPEVITKTSATVSMTSTFSPSTYGQPVTFTFTATGVLGTPSGTVAISDGATLLATPTLNASGVATFTTANLTVGSHTLTAVYGGDANYK